MGNLLAAGAAFLAAANKAHMSQSVTYRRGSDTITGLAAKIGKTTFEIDNGQFTETIESRDFIINTADLKFGDTAIRPANGDTITEVTMAGTFTYEVCVPKGQQVASMSEYRDETRIHTKLLTRA